MSEIQRKLIRDDGRRVVIRQNHYLGLVFVAFAVIPAMVPFKSNATAYGTALTSLGALAVLAFGLGVLAWRKSIELDFEARTCTLRSGFWPQVRSSTAPLSLVTTVRLDERRRGFGVRRTTYELSFALGGDEAFAFFETGARDEALEEREHWLARLQPPPSGQTTLRAAA